MSEQNLNTNITATANFAGLTAQLDAVTAGLIKLQETTIGLNKNLSNQISVMNRSFTETMRSTGQFSTHFVTLTSDVDKFGKNLDSGRLKLSQYFNTWQSHVKKTGTIISDLAKQQVMLENSIIQPLGKNAQGLMQYNVMVQRGLDETKNKMAIARQEASIMNKVMQDGANQLINWGKNTQWAGRQLTVGLTVPLAAFGAAASKAFQQADQELVRLTKVYGGLSATSTSELAKVRKDVSATAKEMASMYGAAYTDTISLAADIAATGKTGNDLLKSTKETTRLAVLGETSHQDAMKATLSIQNTFKENTDQLAQSIDFLNAVENQTSTSMQDLIAAIPKAGPVIQAMGGSVKDLALMLVAMKEGGIDATTGANALKSALASLINPTKVATDMFKGFGIDLNGLVKRNAGNLTATILELQSALDTLDPLSKQKAIEQLFGKFQFARMNALFSNLNKSGSQTIQVMNLMKASASDLANVSARELSQMTESASGKYKRALESVKADLATVGEQFLKINTAVLKTIDGIVKFINHLPAPIKSVLTFVGGLTALAGPLIMLTGVLGNFFGYIIKGIFHLKALFKGGEGFKLLTPEIMAAEKAGKTISETFYTDAKATTTFADAVFSLANSFDTLRSKALPTAVEVSQSITAMTGGGAQAATNSVYAARMADKNNPLIGKPYTRDMVHLNPTGSKTQDERLAETIFSTMPGPKPVNQRIGNNPQVYMTGDMPKIQGVTAANGVSTGIVAEEAAKWHAMNAALATQSEAELKVLRTEVAATGNVTAELAQAYDAMLPPMIDLTTMAAKEASVIVEQLQAGKLTVDAARAKIFALNSTVEAMMAETAQSVASGLSRNINLTTVPLTSQPVVSATGKSNMKELFHKGNTASLLNKIAGVLGVRTSGGGYSIETTIPKKFANGNIVPGSGNQDTIPAMLTPGEFVVRKSSVNSETLPILRAINDGKQSSGGGYSLGGIVLQALEARARRIGGGRARNLRGSSSGPSSRSIYEGDKTPYTYHNLHRPGNAAGRRAWEGLSEYGQEAPNTKYDTIMHGASSSFRERTAHLPTGQRSATGVATRDQLTSDFGMNVRGRFQEAFVLPDNYVVVRGENSRGWNTALDSPMGASTLGWGGVSAKDMTSLAITLKENNVNPEVARQILQVAAIKLNQKIRSKERINGSEFGDYLAQAQEEAVSLFVSKFGSGDIVLPPGFKKTNPNSRIKTGPYLPSMRKRELVNTDPAHGLLQIGKLVSGVHVRNQLVPDFIRYSQPSGRQPDFVNAKKFMTGTQEDRAKYILKQYMSGSGGYELFAQEGTRDLLSVLAKKATGTFFRGVNLNGSLTGGTMSSLPPSITQAIRLAQQTGDWSGLIGKEFILRRSSWSSNPETAKGFGNILIESNIRNRNVIPASEIFPDTVFHTPQGQVKVNENESIFGGRFKIVHAENGKLKIEGINAREFGGPVNGKTPYLVGERGPEMFVPQSSGKIVPHYGVGGIVGQLGLMAGTSLLGNMAASKLGGPAGNAIGMLANMIPFMMMGNMGGGRAGSIMNKIPGNKVPMGVLNETGALTKYGSALTKMSYSGNILKETLAKAAFGLTKFNVALAVGTTAAVLAYKAWKNHQESLRLNALGYGLTAEAAQKAGVKFTNYNSVMKQSIQNAKDLVDRNQLIYESMASSGTPLNLTIQEYKKLKTEVKSVYGDQIKLINQTKSEKLSGLAVRLKSELVAAGMSAEDATKKIYTMFKLSNKASSAVLMTTGNKAFSKIQDSNYGAQVAASQYGRATETENGKTQAAALNTAMMGLDTATQDLMAKKKITFAEAEKLVIDKVNQSKLAGKKITQETINELAKTNPEITKFANTQDTVISLWQKIRLQAKGYSGDLSTLSEKQVNALSKMSEIITKSTIDANRAGLLKDQYIALDKLTAQQKKYTAAMRGQSVASQISDRDRIAALNKQIDATNKLAEAKKKALQDKQSDTDLARQIEAKKIEIKNMQAVGNTQGAQAAGLDLESLQQQQQTTSQIRAIDAATAKANAPRQAAIDAINNKQQKLSDSAALAGEGLSKLNDKIATQQGKIDDVNNAMIAFRINLEASGKTMDQYINTKEGRGEASVIANKAKAAGITLPKGMTPQQQGADIYNQSKALIDKGISTTGDIYINSKKIANDKNLGVGKISAKSITSESHGYGTTATTIYHADAMTIAQAGAGTPGSVFTDSNGKKWKVVQFDTSTRSFEVKKAGFGTMLARAGMPLVVGDRGKPELFIPRTDGMIVPSLNQIPFAGPKYNVPTNGYQMRDAHSGSASVVNITQNIYPDHGMNTDAFVNKVVQQTRAVIRQDDKINAKMVGVGRSK